MNAWALRRLITEFARAAKRPHIPREAAMRSLYIQADIPLPEGSWVLYSASQVHSELFSFLS